MFLKNLNPVRRIRELMEESENNRTRYNGEILLWVALKAAGSPFKRRQQPQLRHAESDAEVERRSRDYRRVRATRSEVRFPLGVVPPAGGEVLIGTRAPEGTAQAPTSPLRERTRQPRRDRGIEDVLDGHLDSGRDPPSLVMDVKPR